MSPKDYVDGKKTTYGRVRQLARGLKIESEWKKMPKSKNRTSALKVALAVQKESVQGHKTKKK